jgi:hypothetical protein
MPSPIALTAFTDERALFLSSVLDHLAAAAGLLERITGILARLHALLRRRVPSLGQFIVHMSEGFLQLIVQSGLFSECGVSRHTDSFLAALC